MKTYLGIELGSTRIKAVLIDTETLDTVATGAYSWKSELRGGIWTYDVNEAFVGIKSALSKIKELDTVAAVGVSGMMHGYLAFDENWNLLVPFRTWQNIMTERAVGELSPLFDFNLPQRWSSAHLYEAVLREEEHVSRVAHITTLSSYIHYMLTGENVVGIGEASGIFPVDSETLQYDAAMLEKFNERLRAHGFTKRAEDVFPRVLVAGECGGRLTERGRELLGGGVPVGTPFAPPEGDAGTGMVATNSVAVKSGNISAGTSIFTMIVLERKLSRLYREISMVTTPDGKPVAMVNSNNCTTDMNAWISVFKEMFALFGKEIPDEELYTKLYKCSLEGDGDCDGVLICNYLAGEVVGDFQRGVPMMLRRPDSKFNLSNFMRSQIYGAMVTISIGMDIFKREGALISRLIGHGGLFKTPGVAQRYLAAACDTDIVCLETSGEGGPYGMALLAAYMIEKEGYSSLGEFLERRAFSNMRGETLSPTEEDKQGFSKYIEEYKKLLELERRATQIY